MPPEPARPVWMRVPEPEPEPTTPARKIERVVEIDGSYVGLLEDDPEHVVVLTRTGDKAFAAKVVPLRWSNHNEEMIG